MVVNVQFSLQRWGRGTLSIRKSKKVSKFFIFAFLKHIIINHVNFEHYYSCQNYYPIQHHCMGTCFCNKTYVWRLFSWYFLVTDWKYHCVSLYNKIIAVNGEIKILLFSIILTTSWLFIINYVTLINLKWLLKSEQEAIKEQKFGCILCITIHLLKTEAYSIWFASHLFQVRFGTESYVHLLYYYI